MNTNNNKLSSMNKYLSTGELAEMCSVTPDTVLKWIRAGKIPATRTPGGHHRIPRGVLNDLLNKGKKIKPKSNIFDFQYCWEFNSKSGILPEGCQNCIVYRSRTHRCYEIKDLPTEAGHVGLFCKSSCDECEYYQKVIGQCTNVLVVTDQTEIKDFLEESNFDSKFNMKITDCEYRSSMLIDKFRPDYIVIDCSLGSERSKEFALLLHEDPRIPFVRVVLVGGKNSLPDECDKLVFALINQPFNSEILTNLVMSFQANNKEMQ